jgi:flagellar biogenesis protein FliO
MRRRSKSTARVALLLIVVVAACGADWAEPSAEGTKGLEQRRAPEQREPDPSASAQRASTQRRRDYPALADRILAQRVADESATRASATLQRVQDEREQPTTSEGRAMRDAAITGTTPDNTDKPVRGTGPTGPMPLRLSHDAARPDRTDYVEPSGPLDGRETAGAQSDVLGAESNGGDGIPLAPPSGSRRSEPGKATPVTPTKALTTVLASLGVVLGLFLLVVWFTRRALPKAVGGLPSEVVEVIGRAPLANRQQMSLVRIGHKLVLLSVTQHGAESLTEITDPDEVNRLCGICREGQPGSISATFRQVLGQMSSEPRWEGGDRRRGGEPSDATQRGAGPSPIRQAERR